MALKSYLTYKILQEMAAPGRGVLRGTVTNLPIQYDKDDMLFLRQFDSKHWPDAIHARHEMLHDALIKLQKSRDAMAGVERSEDGLRIVDGGLADNIKKFLMGEESDLTSEEKQEIIKRHTFRDGTSSLPLKPGVTDAFWSERTPKAKVTEKDIDELAEDDAFEIIKKQTENIEDAIDLPKGKVEFKIGKLKTVRAFPYLNRLYHKLERTRGESHHPSSGYDPIETGEHGFDLSHPSITKSEEGKVKRTTRGLNWVEPTIWDRSLKGVGGTSSSSFRAGYLAHSAYNHFGDLKETAAYKKAQESGTLKWLPMDGKEGRIKVEDPKIEWLIDYEIKKVKEECVAKAHSEGTKCNKSYQQFKEEAKNNVYAMIERGEVSAHPVPGIPDEERKYKLEGGEPNVQYIYLPHYKTSLPREEGEPAVEKYVPILKKSFTLTKKGIHDFEKTSIEEDSESLETGERTGVVNVGVTPNRSQPAQAYADPRVASNYHLKQFLNSLLVSGYRIKGLSIDGVVPEFIKGIIQGISGGGTSPGVQNQLRRDPEAIMDLHQLVFNFVLEKHLAAKKIQTEEGRIQLARNLVSSYLQKAKYEVQRRLRQKGVSIGGYGDVSTGEEGKEFDPGTGAVKADSKRGRGVAIFSKNLQDIRQSLSQMEKKISSQQAATPKIEKGESFEDSKAKLDKIMQNIKEKSEFFETLKSGLIDSIRMTEKQADELVKSWQEAEANPNQPEWTLERVKEAFMGMLQSAKEGGELQVVRPEAPKIVFSKPAKVVSPLARPQMKPTGPSPLLGRKSKINQPPNNPTDDQSSSGQQQMDWNRLSGLTISERIEYLKDRLKG